MPSRNINRVLEDLEPENASYDDLHHLLAKQASEWKPNNPAELAKFGARLLDHNWRRLPVVEVSDVQEAVAISALEIGSVEAAKECVQAIAEAFPSSSRAACLQGVSLEASGRFDEADAVYKSELEKDPYNGTIVHRTAAAKQGRGDYNGALDILKAHLTVHMTDVLAWEEMAHIYIKTMMYSHAIFCLDEVLLQSPGTVNTIILLGDAFYTAGGRQYWKTARGYYSMVVELTQAKNARALYGICACSAQLAKSKQSETRENSTEIQSLAKESLLQLYAVQNPSKVAVAQAPF